MFVHISGAGKRQVNIVCTIDSRQAAAYTLGPDFLEGDIPYGKEFNLGTIGLYVQSMCFIEKKQLKFSNRTRSLVTQDEVKL